nr:MAG TPA: hypothetical protein [Caudoviricetes sp.]
MERKSARKPLVNSSARKTWKERLKKQRKPLWKIHG